MLDAASSGYISSSSSLWESKEDRIKALPMLLVAPERLSLCRYRRDWRKCAAKGRVQVRNLPRHGVLNRRKRFLPHLTNPSCCRSRAGGSAGRTPSEPTRNARLPSCNGIFRKRISVPFGFSITSLSTFFLPSHGEGERASLLARTASIGERPARRLSTSFLVSI